MRNLHRLVDAVQKNCDISDARYARDMTMCTYLLEMREYFRWEHDIPLDQPPPKEELGSWLSQREERWSTVEAESFEPLPVGGEHYDPFEIEAINRELNPWGLVYGGGYGRFRKPHFFLGELVKRERRAGFEVLVTGCEYARDITAIPAAFQNGAIFVRQDALRRWLWEKVELWSVKRADTALKSALECYGYEADPRHGLERMTAVEGEAVILHEIGEGLAERLLGPDWRDMISSFTRKRPEILARGVRDHLADCLSTLPGLIERRAQCSLHFYFANLEGMRRALFPRLVEGYRQWRESGNPAPLLDCARAGTAHWADVASRLIDLYRKDPAHAEAAIEELLGEGQAALAL
jgi:uncharacterized protein DUF6866